MSKQNVDLAKRWFEEVWNKRRLDAIDEMATDDVVGHGEAEHGKDLRGKAHVKVFATHLLGAFPDIKVTPMVSVAEGDLVALRWQATMSHKGPFMGIAATGRNLEITGTTIFRFADGKIAEAWDNWDQLAMMVQIGAVPAASFLPA
jgi:steroid delta-isomerase-like uncharacterized protein